MSMARFVEFKDCRGTASATCIPERPDDSALVGTDENRSGLQGIQEGKQLLLLGGTQLAELSGYVLRLTPMAIDRLIQR